MKSPYVLIEGKKIAKMPNLDKLNSLEKSYQLDAFAWFINQIPDREGNIAVFKEELDEMELEDNVSEFLGEFEVDIKNVGKKIILFMPKEITEKYFDVILSEEIYCRTEEEIIEQLQRMYEHPLYVDYVKDLLRIVNKEIGEGNIFSDGSLLIRKPVEIRLNNDTFYSIYWVYRDTCCGSRCSGCQMFYFPDYSISGIKKFIEKIK